MVNGAVRTELEALRVGDSVTIIDDHGRRFAGVVVARRKDVDPPDSLPLRRVGGTVQWISYERIAAVERG